MTQRLRRFALSVLVLSPLGCSMPAGMNETCDWPAAAAHSKRDLIGDGDGLLRMNEPRQPPSPPYSRR